LIQLKNLYNKEYINLLSNIIKKHYSSFDISNFTKRVFNLDWKNKELKQRMRHIAICLYEYLPKEYSLSIEILKNSFQDINYDFSLENMKYELSLEEDKKL